MKIFSDDNVLKGLDDYNLRMADMYMTGCEPKQIEPDSGHHSGDYNCNHCDDQDCNYWLDFNGVQIEETIPVGFGVQNKTSLEIELSITKGKARRKIRRQLRKMKEGKL